jgi:hypothetical protein
MAGILSELIKGSDDFARGFLKTYLELEKTKQEREEKQRQFQSDLEKILFQEQVKSAYRKPEVTLGSLLEQIIPPEERVRPARGVRDTGEPIEIYSRTEPVGLTDLIRKAEKRGYEITLGEKPTIKRREKLTTVPEGFEITGYTTTGQPIVRKVKRRKNKKIIGYIRKLKDKNAPIEDIKKMIRYEGENPEDYADEIENYLPKKSKWKFW